MDLMFSSWERKLLQLSFLISIIFLVYFLYVSGYEYHSLGIYTQIPLTIIPVVGGLIGLERFKQWGMFKSMMGKALLFLSLGMIVWGVALGMWTYYYYVNITLPYPSLADYVFIWSPPLWIIGLVFLSKVVGAPFAFKNPKETLLGLGVGVLVAIVSYYILVVIGHENVLSLPEDTFTQLFFNYAYTAEILVVVVFVGTSYMFSKKYLGGKFKMSVLQLFLGFLIHFFAVFFFVYTITKGTYFNGNIADILFTLAVYLESLGIINLDPKLATNAKK